MTSRLSQEELDILKGLQEILDGRGEVLTPEAMKSRRRGRPPLPTVKVGVKIRLDADLLGVLRASGAGWQTRINEVLRREFMDLRPAAETISLSMDNFFRSVSSALILKAETPDSAEVIHVLNLDGEHCHV